MASTKTDKKRDEREIPLNLETIISSGLTWTHIEKPAERETEYLAQTYPFHPLNLDDVLSRIQRPKIDEYKDHDFIVLRFPFVSQDTGVVTSVEMDIFIGKDYLVTADCTGDLKPLSKFFRLCQTNEEAREENLSHGSGYLLYRILDRLVDYCLPIVNKIMDGIEKVEDDIFANSSRNPIREISVLRRNIITIRRIIWPLRAVIGRVENRIRRFTDINLEDYFGDTIDHIDKIWDTLEEYKEVTEGLNDTHDSLASNRINDVLRVLTILTTIGTMLTLVASFYGMNVVLPGDVEIGTPHTWIVLLMIMLVTTVGMLYYFSRKHWL
jgi:magnesium transporter